ncbi:Stage V sporulation protein K [Penicillium subrubescens]|uniref:Stage V sporulation protein K n=1 Tax=Penicillium subrubescens TaxID=1316194 RepID=A0A1Q5UAD6_9EURO|nr:Stage V sporulation protein K [Penicillium subrubescens]
MQQMFQNVNPGLSRRFPMDQAFVFEDFTKQELDLILDLKLKEQGYSVTDRARRVVSDMLERARNRPHFGNAGEVDILLNAAKMCHQKRLSSGGSTTRASDAILDAADFDENFDRADKNEASVPKLFEGVVGCENIVSKLEGYQQVAKSLRQLNMDPRGRLPFNFVFRGPPGTGKTSTARKMGQVYYDMGLLASNEVVDVSATDLVGQYIGHTGPKTQKLLESALGKILFIDEAYRLAEGHFAKEAMDELVDCITKPKFAQRLIIILAGYDADINRLMSMNPGLTSRFPESIQFEPLSPRECIRLLDTLLSKEKGIVLENAQVEFDITCLQRPDPQLTMEMSQRFDVLSRTARWANARDVETVKQSIFGRTLKSLKACNGKKLLLSKRTVIEELDNMIQERSKREHYLVQRPSTGIQRGEPELSLHSRPVDEPITKVEPKTFTKAGATADVNPNTAIEPEKQQQAALSDRDPDVSEEVWDQLRKDKATADTREMENLRVMKEVEEQKKKILRLKEEEELAAKEAQKAEADVALRRHHEQARLLHELERRRQEGIVTKLERQREALAEARRKEQANQEKLKTMGVCPVGYRWIKQSAGYRYSPVGNVIAPYWSPLHWFARRACSRRPRSSNSDPKPSTALPNDVYSHK